MQKNALEGLGLTRATCFRMPRLVDPGWSDVCGSRAKKATAASIRVQDWLCSSSASHCPGGETFTTVFKKLNTYPFEWL